MLDASKDLRVFSQIRKNAAASLVVNTSDCRVLCIVPVSSWLRWLPPRFPTIQRNCLSRQESEQKSRGAHRTKSRRRSRSNNCGNEPLAG